MRFRKRYTILNGIFIDLYSISFLKDLTDTDYDFPAGSEDAGEAHEWEEYDEPQPVIPDTSSHMEQREETNMDYDDPVQRYR